MKADEHEEIAKAVEMCRENGWERAAFILARAWHEEIHKARKAKRKPVDDDKED